MRLLVTEGSEREDWQPCLYTRRHESYAILSHRWSSDPNHEVLFADIQNIDRTTEKGSSSSSMQMVKNVQYAGVEPNRKIGFDKIRGAARQAQRDGHEYIWIDTCCIDKNSSAELSEAINSMWMWYSESDVCYVYLADVRYKIGDRKHEFFSSSQWWTRGWTLQELLAPQQLAFFCSTWNLIGYKKDMDMTISRITGIDCNVINGTLSLDSISIARRMCWAGRRTTTRVEDIAYCLLGMFNVNMPLLYGEGEKAFIRLQQEIMTISDDESIFAWRDYTMDSRMYSGLLAAHPSVFVSSANVVRLQDGRDRAPYRLTNKGLSISLPLERESSVPGGTGPTVFKAMLQCVDPDWSTTQICIYLEKLSETSEQYARIRCDHWTTPNETMSGQAKTIYVKQTQRHVYDERKLDGLESKLRLFRVIPTDDVSTPRITLIEADVDVARYVMLEGNRRFGQPQHHIRVDEKWTLVGEGFFHLLKRLGQKPSDELFWEFDVCSDPTRRGRHQIYSRDLLESHATKVVLWAGDEIRGGIKAQKVMNAEPEQRSKSLHRAKDQSLLYEELANEMVTNLVRLLLIAMHPYWKRILTIKMVFQSRSIVVMMLDSELDLVALKSMYQHTLSKIEPENLYLTDDLLWMGRLLQVIPTEDQLQTCIGDFQQLYIYPLHKQFQLMRHEDQQRLAWSLSKVDELSRRLELDITERRIEVFFEAISCFEENLTLAILPPLLQASGLNRDEVLSTLSQRDNHPFYVFSKVTYVSLNQNIQDDVDINTRFSRCSIDASAQLVKIGNRNSNDGLVFTRTDDINNAWHNALTDISYRLSHVHLGDEFGQYSVKPLRLPSKPDSVWTNSYSLLDDTVDAGRRLRIHANKKGVAVLAWCLKKYFPDL